MKGLIRITIAVIGVMFLTGVGTLANINEANSTTLVQDNLDLCAEDRCKVVNTGKDNDINEVYESTNKPDTSINTH